MFYPNTTCKGPCSCMQQTIKLLNVSTSALAAIYPKHTLSEVIVENNSCPCLNTGPSPCIFPAGSWISMEYLVVDCVFAGAGLLVCYGTDPLIMPCAGGMFTSDC